MSKMILTLLALVAVLGLVAAGCGGDDDGGDGPDAPAAEDGDQGADRASADADPEAEVEQVVREFMVALATADADTACPMISEEFLAESWAQAGEEAPSCEEVFALISEFNDEQELEVAGEMVPVDELDEVEFDVEVSDDGRSATVTAEDDPEALRLEHRGGRWVIVGSD